MSPKHRTSRGNAARSARAPEPVDVKQAESIPEPVAEADSLDGFRVLGKSPRKAPVLAPEIQAPVAEAATTVDAVSVAPEGLVVEVAAPEPVAAPEVRRARRVKKSARPVDLAEPAVVAAVETPVATPVAVETPVAAGETPVVAGETPVVAGETPVVAGETPVVAAVEALVVETTLIETALAETRAAEAPAKRSRKRAPSLPAATVSSPASEPEGVVPPASPLVDSVVAPVAEGEVPQDLTDSPPPTPPHVPLDATAELAVMNAAIAAIEGARPRNLEMQLEALLFSTNSPLTEDELAAALGVSRDEASLALRSLERTLEARPSSIALWSRPKGGHTAYILDVKAPFRRDVASLAPPALRVALVETLALIALNQPVSQRRLVAERGGTVYEHVKELTELGYVQKQRKGINFYLKTTVTFATEFGLPDEPDMIRQALAKAAGLSGATSAITSNRVWIEGEPPPELQASMAEAAAVAAAAAAERLAAEEAEATRAARVAAEEAAAREAALAQETAARLAAEEATALAAARASAEAEAAAKLALEMMKAPAEDCLVAGAEATPLGKGKKKRRALVEADDSSGTAEVEAHDPLRDVLSGLGGSGLAW